MAIGDLIIVFSGLFLIRDMKQSHEQHVSFISDLIEKVEKGERLDSIEKLRQKGKDSTKKEAKTK